MTYKTCNAPAPYNQKHISMIFSMRNIWLPVQKMDTMIYTKITIY
jgi:hypothetical protein